MLFHGCQGLWDGEHGRDPMLGNTWVCLIQSAWFAPENQSIVRLECSLTNPAMVGPMTILIIVFLLFSIRYRETQSACNTSLTLEHGGDYRTITLFFCLISFSFSVLKTCMHLCVCVRVCLCVSACLCEPARLCLCVCVWDILAWPIHPTLKISRFIFDT